MGTKTFPIETHNVQDFLIHLLDGIAEQDEIERALIEACSEDLDSEGSDDAEEDSGDHLEPPHILSVSSFGEASLLTRDHGVVLRFADACGFREFQVTIVRSR